jgi:hypothetical protein
MSSSQGLVGGPCIGSSLRGGGCRAWPAGQGYLLQRKCFFLDAQQFWQWVGETSRGWEVWVAIGVLVSRRVHTYWFTLNIGQKLYPVAFCRCRQYQHLQSAYFLVEGAVVFLLQCLRRSSGRKLKSRIPDGRWWLVYVVFSLETSSWRALIVSACLWLLVCRSVFNHRLGIKRCKSSSRALMFHWRAPLVMVRGC